MSHICRSPALKAVGLVSCGGVSNEGFTHLVARCPLLEDLMLVLCPNICGRDVYEATGRACPQLRRFRLRTGKSGGEALGVAAMHGLRTLALYGSDVTNDELAAVLDGCPHLESLHLSECFKIVADDALRARCAGIKSLVFGRRSAQLLNRFRSSLLHRQHGAPSTSSGVRHASSPGTTEPAVLSRRHQEGNVRASCLDHVLYTILVYMFRHDSAR